MRIEPDCLIEGLKSPAEVEHQRGQEGWISLPEIAQFLASELDGANRRRGLNGCGSSSIGEYADFAHKGWRLQRGQVRRAVGRFNQHVGCAGDNNECKVTRLHLPF